MEMVNGAAQVPRGKSLEKVTLEKKWKRFKSREIFLKIFVIFEIFFQDFWDF